MIIDHVGLSARTNKDSGELIVCGARIIFEFGMVRPPVLHYITPPTARIIAALGARVTSIESIGTSILLGCFTEVNLGADDATPMDVGFRDIGL